MYTGINTKHNLGKKHFISVTGHVHVLHGHQYHSAENKWRADRHCKTTSNINELNTFVVRR